MNIPLHQFEQYIDETILQRGFSYFKNGYVNLPEQITPGQYQTMVEGTENYTVRLKLKNGIIEAHSCDCPYDYGPICKHVAAVIFHLQQEELEFAQHNSQPRTKGKKSQKKTVAQQVDDLLAKLSHDELKQFMKDQATNDPSFRRVLLSTFAHLNNDESKTFYTEQIKSILKTAARRSGFIDWREARNVGKAVGDLMETAQKHFNSGNYQSALWIACVVMEEMTEALQFADDSNADIGSNIDMAYNLLVDMASRELSEELRQQLFNYTLKAFEEGIFSGWDWHLGILNIASMILSNENEAEKVIALLDQVEKKEWDYEFREAQALKLQILQKTRGEHEADKFIEQNLSNEFLRTEAIQKAISKRDYAKAISIAKDGIEQDKSVKPGLVLDWYNWLLKIAIEQKDTEKLIEYARLLFVDSIRDKQAYYDILKAHVDMRNWNSFVNELVNDIKKQRHWFKHEVIANIYVNEESWEELWVFVKLEFSNGRIGLDFIKRYENYLSKDYPDKLAGLYQQGIIDLMTKRTGRSHYRNACRYIRRMIKLGAKEKADKLIEKLRTAYPQRRALMDELENV